jgi:hypothetical protein
VSLTFISSRVRPSKSGSFSSEVATILRSSYWFLSEVCENSNERLVLYSVVEKFKYYFLIKNRSSNRMTNRGEILKMQSVAFILRRTRYIYSWNANNVRKQISNSKNSTSFIRIEQFLKVYFTLNYQHRKRVFCMKSNNRMCYFTIIISCITGLLPIHVK